MTFRSIRSYHRQPEPIFDPVGESYFFDIVAEHGPVFIQPNNVTTADVRPTDGSGRSTHSLPGQPIGQLDVAGSDQLGTAAQLPHELKQNIFTWSDDLDYTRGRHSLKFGFIFNHFQWYRISGAVARGLGDFAGLAQFLTAHCQTFNEDPPGSILGSARSISTRWDFMLRMTGGSRRG